jgi:hypothetical protein
VQPRDVRAAGNPRDDRRRGLSTDADLSLGHHFTRKAGTDNALYLEAIPRPPHLRATCAHDAAFVRSRLDAHERGQAAVKEENARLHQLANHPTR